MRILAAAVLLCTACSSPTSPTSGLPLPLTSFDSSLVGSLSFTGYDQQTTIVVRDRETWGTTWRQLYARRLPLPPMPDVDFSSEMVVLVAAGSKPSSGYDVLLTGAVEDSGGVTVDALARSPAPGCVVLAAITQPVALGRLPKRNSRVAFRIASSVNDCR